MRRRARTLSSGTDIESGAEANDPLDREQHGSGAPGASDEEYVALDEGADRDELGRGIHWSRVVVLVLAVAFLGGAIGYFLANDRQPGADSVEVGFAQDMIRHHEQAIQLAQLELAAGTDPTARAFAQEVLIFQSYEMGLLDQKLHDWGFNRQDRSDEAMAWMDMAVPVEAMPGMVTEEQLDELAAAEGAEADALFVELMIGHHQGGVHMAEEAAARTDDERVAELAETIGRNQRLEIEEYEQLLDRLNASEG